MRFAMPRTVANNPSHQRKILHDQLPGFRKTSLKTTYDTTNSTQLAYFTKPTTTTTTRFVRKSCCILPGVTAAFPKLRRIVGHVHAKSHHLPAETRSAAAAAAAVGSAAGDAAAGAARSPGVSPAPSSWATSVAGSARVVAEAYHRGSRATRTMGRRRSASTTIARPAVGVTDLARDCSGTSRSHRARGSYRRKIDNFV